MSTRGWPSKNFPAPDIEREKARLLRRYNRPWWRALRWWDRRRGRG